MPRPYIELARVLLAALGENIPQRLVADRLYVSQESVHCWLSGKHRPAPDRLGAVTALFRLDPDLVVRLARYDDNPEARRKFLASYAAATSNTACTPLRPAHVSPRAERHPQ